MILSVSVRKVLWYFPLRKSKRTTVQKNCANKPQNYRLLRAAYHKMVSSGIQCTPSAKHIYPTITICTQETKIADSVYPIVGNMQKSAGHHRHTDRLHRIERYGFCLLPFACYSSLSLILSFYCDANSGFCLPIFVPILLKRRFLLWSCDDFKFLCCSFIIVVVWRLAFFLHRTT